MQFIKNHYEKIILSLVLLGLAALLVVMWFVIAKDKQDMSDMRMTYFPKKPQPLPALDMSPEQAALAQIQSPVTLDFTTTNKLFNPMTWVLTRDNQMVKKDTLTPNSCKVTSINPLYFSITLDSVDASGMANGGEPRYKLTVEDQAATVPAQRRKRPHFAALKEHVKEMLVTGKNEGFAVAEIKGPPASPDALILKLDDGGQLVTVTKDQPYKVVDGYDADLNYSPDKMSWTAQRVGDQISFGGDTYNVIAIDANRVILLAQSNQRKWPLPYAP